MLPLALPSIAILSLSTGFGLSPGSCLLPHIGGGPDIAETDLLVSPPQKHANAALLQAPVRKEKAPVRKEKERRPPRRSRPAQCTAADDSELFLGPPVAQATREQLKAELIAAAAACNRGFGATRADRERIDTLFRALEPLSPTAVATAGFEGGADDGGAPLAGLWRLIYTTANDVLSLDVSPIAGVGAVYQLFEPPSDVTNIIDLYPRLETLLPVGTLRSATRLRVMTSARARSETRVGLTFYAAKAEQRALLGVDVSKVFPALGGPIPRLPGSVGTDPATDTSPSYFDVCYVDEGLLLIRQNSPGGVFAAVRVDAAELEGSAL